MSVHYLAPILMRSGLYQRIPPRLEIRHRFLPGGGIALIIGALRHARRDRPEQSAIWRPRVRPHDATDVLVAVPHVIINVRPLAAQSAFGGAFESEHGSA